MDVDVDFVVELGAGVFGELKTDVLRRA
jgi:hypothetical protein